jgi:hypothetical protein
VPIGGPGARGAGPCFDYRAGGVTLNGQFFPFVESVQGLQLPNSPRLQANLSLGYRVALSTRGTLIPSIDLSYEDKQYVQIYNTPVDLFPSRRNVNVKLTYLRSRWIVEGFATNLTGETYPVAHDQPATETFNPPRQFGLRVTLSY